MTPEAEVVAAAQARADALAAGDAVALTALLHPDFRWTAHNGASFDRTAYVARNTDGRTRWHRQQLGDPVVVVVGDAAVLRTTVTDVVAGTDGEEVFRMPMTQVWVSVEGSWSCLGGHAGPRLAPPTSLRHVLVVVTGLPGSGKSTLGRQLAEAVGIPFLDKDGILEALFDALGSRDHEERGRLSRAADDVLLSQLRSVPSAVVVNWWNEESLSRLRSERRTIVEVHCECDLETASARFASRRRHPGHHDDAVPVDERERRADLLRETWTGAHHLGPVVTVDTTVVVDIDAVVARVVAES